MYFKDKYFKYKKKYLALKKLQQIGSSDPPGGEWTKVSSKKKKDLDKGSRGRGSRGRGRHDRGGHGKDTEGVAYVESDNVRKAGHGRDTEGVAYVESDNVRKAVVLSYERGGEYVIGHKREIKVSNRWSYDLMNPSVYDKDSPPKLGKRQLSIPPDVEVPYYIFLKSFEDRFKGIGRDAKGYDFTGLVYSRLQKEKIYESNDFMFKGRFQNKKYKFKIDRINWAKSGIYINLIGMKENEYNFNDNIKLSLHSSKDLKNRIHIVLENLSERQRVLIPCQLNYDNGLEKIKLELFDEEHERKFFKDSFLDNYKFKYNLIILFNKIFEDLQIYSVTKNGLGEFNPDNFKLDTQTDSVNTHRSDNYTRGGKASNYRKDNYKKRGF